MKLVKRDGEWWIIEVPESEDCGPYETKEEAEEGRVGLERTERWGHLHSFWTCEKKATRKKKPVDEVEKPPKKPPKKPVKKKTVKRKKRVTK